MSLQKNVLMKESLAQERRRRSSTKELNVECIKDVVFVTCEKTSSHNRSFQCGRRRSTRVSLDDSGSEFPVFVDRENGVEENDDAEVFSSSPPPSKFEEKKQQKIGRKRRGLQALLNSRILDLENCLVYGKESGSRGSSNADNCGETGGNWGVGSGGEPSPLKRRRSFRCSSISPARSRVRSNSLSIGLASRCRPVRRWTKVDGDWIPVGGVKKRVPGGLKDRLQKMLEKRERKVRKLDEPKTAGGDRSREVHRKMETKDSFTASSSTPNNDEIMFRGKSEMKEWTAGYTNGNLNSILMSIERERDLDVKADERDCDVNEGHMPNGKGENPTENAGEEIVEEFIDACNNFSFSEAPWSV